MSVSQAAPAPPSAQEGPAAGADSSRDDAEDPVSSSQARPESLPQLAALSAKLPSDMFNAAELWNEDHLAQPKPSSSLPVRIPACHCRYDPKLTWLSFCAH